MKIGWLAHPVLLVAALAGAATGGALIRWLWFSESLMGFGDYIFAATMFGTVPGWTIGAWANLITENRLRGMSASALPALPALAASLAALLFAGCLLVALYPYRNPWPQAVLGAFF